MASFLAHSPIAFAAVAPTQHHQGNDEIFWDAYSFERVLTDSMQVDDIPVMFSKPASSAPKTAEHRGNRREPMIGVTAMVRSQHGALREGVVQDVSDGGVGISGDSTGLCLGEMVDVVLVIQGDHVAYKGQLRHVGDRFFGVRFLSGPHRTTERQGMKQCRACKKEYPHEHSYCFRCGQRLVGGSVRPQSANPKPLLS